MSAAHGYALQLCANRLCLQMYKMLNANAHLTLKCICQNAKLSLFARVCKTSLVFHAFKCICFFDPVKRQNVLSLLFAEDLFDMTTIIMCKSSASICNLF